MKLALGPCPSRIKGAQPRSSGFAQEIHDRREVQSHIRRHHRIIRCQWVIGVWSGSSAGLYRMRAAQPHVLFRSASLYFISCSSHLTASGAASALVWSVGGGMAAAKNFWWFCQTCPLSDTCTNNSWKRANVWSATSEEPCHSRMRVCTLAAQPQSNFEAAQPRSCVGRAQSQASMHSSGAFASICALLV